MNCRMSDEQAGLTYRTFIDEMVKDARQSVLANRIAAHGHTERTNDLDLPLEPDEVLRKEFCEGLGPDQKVILAHLLTEEREGAFHDVLAYLEWAVSTGRLSVIGAHGSFASEVEDTMHGDYISRLAGHRWQASWV
ncbi:DUF6547 family protein [Sphingomonas bacterium]|uniref:DUF6547 family protein n=1 Tax=Sphingomonas bacterium TaxID=1895847 RepID=UPI00345B5982